MNLPESASSIYRSMSRFLSGTMLSRISGLGRDIAMAYAFGTSGPVAAFLVSLRFAHLLRRVLGEGCLQSAFIPLFEELKKDPAKASAFFYSLKKNLSLLLVFTSIAFMAVFGGCLLLFDLSSGNQEILTYTLLMMPSLIFICLYGLEASLLQCEGIFFLPSIAPIAFNLLWMSGALLLSSLSPANAMPLLSLFIIAGCFLQWIVLVPKSRSLLPVVKTRSNDFMRIIKPMFLGMIGVAATQVNSALDAVFARFASAEGPAYLWYAIRIEQLPLALFGVALSGALLPPLTRSIKANNTEMAKSFYTSAIRTSLVFMIPLTFALIISGNVSVSLLYQHGDFDNISTKETVTCLWGYALGLLPAVLVLITSSLFFAHSDYKTPSKASCFSVLMNTVLNFVGVFMFNFGTFWIALATSFSALFNAFVLARHLTLKIEYRGYLKTILKSLACSFLYGILAMAFETFYVQYFGEGHSLGRQLSLFLLHAIAFVIAVGPMWYYAIVPRPQALTV